MQAFGAPASVHLITSYFRRPSERPFANASYTIGLYFGAGLSSLSTIFAKDYLGWRNIYISRLD
jgi:sugar phosphate permease